ncbi:unnamed protein product [Sphagnum troendelagicum]|uniref:Uncharacterized protein n=1 Tax=Sphagnum troendelagicum TaxID=128251 RepID=A0ABP0TCA0_9BRYO
MIAVYTLSAWDFDASGFHGLFDDTRGLLHPHRIIMGEEQQSRRLPVRKQLDPRTFRVKITFSVLRSTDLCVFCSHQLTRRELLK